MSRTNKPTLYFVTLEDLNGVSGQTVRYRRLLPTLAERARLVLAGRPGALPTPFATLFADRIELPMPVGVGAMGYFFGPRGPGRLAAVARALRGLEDPLALLYADSALLAWMMRHNRRRLLAAEINGVIAEEYRAKRYPAQALMAPLLQRWEVAGWRSVDRLIAISPGVAACIRERAGARTPPLVVIGNGIDPETFRPDIDGSAIRRARGWGHAPVGVMVSSFRRWHGVDHLVRALPFVLAERPDFRLALVGDGPERPAAERLARALGVWEAIDWAGAVEPDAVAPWIAAADVGVFFPRCPTPRLGYLFDPIKLYEFLALGKPCVVARLAYLAEEIEAIGAGLRTDPSPEAFARGILTLLADPETRRAMGRRGAEWVRRERTWATLAHRIADWLGLPPASVEAPSNA